MNQFTSSHSIYLAQVYRRTVVSSGLLLTLLWLQPAVAQSTLERLFTTPVVRAELDRRRLRLLQPGVVREEEIYLDAVIETTQEDAVPAVDTIYAVGGSVRRSDGNFTVWINNRTYNQGDLPGNVELLVPYSQGQVRITDPESRQSYVVKPGQVLNLSMGLLMESYQYQAASAAPVAAANAGVLPATDTTDSLPAAAQELLEQAQEIGSSQQ